MLHERIAKRMRVEIGQAHRLKGFAEYVTDWSGPLPAFARAKSNRGKAAVLAKPDLRRRKQRVFVASKQCGAQVVTPVLHNLKRIAANREKPRRKGLAGLGLHVASILIDAALHQIDVL